MTVSIEINVRGLVGVYTIPVVEVCGDDVTFDWGLGELICDGDSVDYEPSKYDEERMIDLAINGEFDK